MLLLDIPPPSTPIAGLAGLIVLAIFVLITVAVLIVAFVLLLKFLQRRKANTPQLDRGPVAQPSSPNQ